MEQSYNIISTIKEEMKGFTGAYAIYYSDADHKIEINSNDVYESASCIKTFVLLVLAKAFEEKKLSGSMYIAVTKEHLTSGSGILKSLSDQVTLTLEDIATLMIMVSDNTATNIIIDILGVEFINDTLSLFGFNQTRLLNSINFDVYNELGQMTAREYGILFEGLLSYRFLNSKYSTWVLNMLSKQHYQTMLNKSLPPALLDNEFFDKAQIEILSKSGSMDQVRNDGGIFRTQYGDYVVVILTKGFKDLYYHQNHESYVYGSKVSNVLFNHFISRKDSSD